MLVRLQKILAEAGVASRRKCEEIIKCGRVSVDGNIVTEMGFCADPLVNVIELDGKRVLPSRERVYIALNKPVGYITSASDQFGRPAVLDLLSCEELEGKRVFPVGRLDYDSSGLLFLTNDGDFAYKLTHPKHNIEKTYAVTVDGEVSSAALKKLTEGVLLDDGVTAPAKVCVTSNKNEMPKLTITITEGRNRQIRRMFEAVGRKVLSLHRISVGGVALGGLESGKYRFLSDTEIKKLIGNGDN